ncbi:pro-sigmaK processing inhibitor BofA family protein [Angelakisella massiliensis]|uniref:pro-sigmaK processing inhibitor BofA family protein n=1 Tax=Angelakisella massiliensis TaxID=1871018 RepID=UPI0008F8ED82|nr:pro-sigmaK processing inhibitor BofA family protein [Angelakisella massiliensis]
MTVAAGLGVLFILGALLIFRLRRLLKAMFFSAVGGGVALAAVNLTGLITGVTLPLNLFSMGVCAVLGAPGVISLLVMQLFW